MIIFDIEANGLNPTRIHCMSWIDLSASVNEKRSIQSTASYDVMREILCSGKPLIGHNIISWDIPNAERLLNITVEAPLLDTLAISYYLYADRPKRKPKLKHGLESWGETFGVKKPEITDWETLDVKIYIHRCEEDVQINLHLWEQSWSYLTKLYGTEKEALRLYSYLGFKLKMVYLASQNPLYVDNPRLADNRNKIDNQIQHITTSLEAVMPKIPVSATLKRPKNFLKANEEFSIAAEKWFAFCKKYNFDVTAEENTYIKEYLLPNANSVSQVKDYLTLKGWVPETFEYAVGKNGKERKVPQIKKKDKTLCPSILKLIPKNPEIKLLEDLSVLNHRAGLLKNFHKKQKDGTLTAGMAGFTNTLRLMHRELVNLPGVTDLGDLNLKNDMSDGVHIRSCLRAKQSYTLCGSDMKALETMTKLHYMWPFDPEYVKAQLVPDFDPHLDLAEFAKVLTPEQIQAHKDKTEDHSIVRHQYKQANYSCTYMVGPTKMARTLGIPHSKAKGIIDAFWAKNWAIKAFASTVVIRQIGNKKWAFNPVSQFWYELRNEKDVFSTINQSTGVYCFDTWMRHSVKLGLDKLSAQFHDEQLFQILISEEEEAKKLLVQAIDKTNQELKLNVKLGIDTHFGVSYAHVH